jgi:hypothetical protein
MSQSQPHSQPFDASIPVLTEVLWGAAEEAAFDPSCTDPAEASYEAPAGADGSSEQWAALEQRLSERILHQVQGSLDVVLDQCLAEVLQGALARLGGEINKSLRQTVEQAVAEAVGEELARLGKADQ